MVCPRAHFTRTLHGRVYTFRASGGLPRGFDDLVRPAHLHRHSFELTSLAGIPTAGTLKDVVMLGGYQEAAVDFVADNPGLTLFHCQQQLHMDFGFMTPFRLHLRIIGGESARPARLR
jgi:Multicopper oxidase